MIRTATAKTLLVGFGITAAALAAGPADAATKSTLSKACDGRTASAVMHHSGKKGTELNILGQAITLMGENYGTQPSDLVVVLGPCIRPPHYEIDFAAEIARQAAAAGVGEFHDEGENTACDLTRHYSYRIEKGCTGRMLALIVRE